MTLARSVLAVALASIVFAEGAFACEGSSSKSPADAATDGAPMSEAASDARRPDASGSEAGLVDGGVPSLTALGVSAAGATDSSPPIVLVPSFSPGVHDYYVRCAEGANALEVSMTACTGSKALLLQPIASRALPEQTLSVSVLENQALVAAATDGTATTEYWVRCLPHDFPSWELSAHPEAGSPPAGYYLLGNADPADGSAGYAIVLSTDGVPVWYQHPTSGPAAFNVDDVVDGAISFIADPADYEVHQLDPLGTAHVAPIGSPLDPHELRALSNGDYLVISSPYLGGVDLTGLGLPLPDGGVAALGPDANIVDCNVLEIDAAGNVVWSWVGTDHFDPAKDSTFPQPVSGASAPDGGPLVDPFHCNSIDVDPTNDNLLISSRNMDSVFYVDRATGVVLWKMGGSAYSKDDAEYVTVADPFYRQHDARLQPGWSSACPVARGQISVFDDESQRSAPARGVVYDVVVGNGGDGGAGDGGGTSADCGATDAGTTGATVAWQYAGTANAAATGSFRISPDGSRVIGWGDCAPPCLAFSEVTLGGGDLLDFAFTGGSSSYRVVKVPTSALDLGVLRSTAGLP
jgi:Arylsulfotransferase (ASST)